MTDDEYVLRSKLLKGLNQSYNRLLQQKKQENGHLVFIKNGKIVTIKARTLNGVEAKQIV